MWYILVLIAAITGTPMPPPQLGAATAGPREQISREGLTAFKSRGELEAFLKRLRDKRQRAQPGGTFSKEEAESSADMAAIPPPPVAAPPPPQEAAPAARAAPDAKSPDGITNNQVAGVDEGGIVKARGDILVVLRRGRLFTVSTAGGGMRPVAAIDAFAPGADPSGDWYDEMLVSGEWIAVIGHSYDRGGTQVNRFRLGDDGSLRFVDAYSFRSQDYYSSRNYASRLLGDKLVLYAPISLDLDTPFDAFPVLRRWDERTRQSVDQPLWSANTTFIPERLMREGYGIDTVHSVTNCDLTAPVLDCEATSVLGTSSRTFFVSQNAVYVWTGIAGFGGGYGGGYGDISPDADFSEGGEMPPPSSIERRPAPGPDALVYRLPFDQSRPQAVAARGQPIDQFSFMADAKRSALQVVVTSGSGGDAMWGPEWTAGQPSLVTIPTGLFGTGSNEVPRERYQQLPGEGKAWGMQNRFVGDHLLYGLGSAGGFGYGVRPGSGARPYVYVVPLATRAVTKVGLPHSVDRLDAIGPDAIVIGQGSGYLGFSAIGLSGTPSLASEYRLPAATEGESRSHAFFFSPDARDRSGQSGLLGLPVARRYRMARGFEASAAVVFLRRQGRALGPNGELVARPSGGQNDGCRASCVDWYGNARPIFRGDRVFALLGYELVEGQAGQGGMRELGRIDMVSLVRGGRVRPRPIDGPIDDGFVSGSSPAP